MQIEPRKVLEPRRIDTFVAIITNSVVNNKNVLRQYELISKLSWIRMYVIVETGVSFDNFKHLPWKMIFTFNNESEIGGILQFIHACSKGGFYT